MDLHNNAEGAQSASFRILEDEDRIELLTRAFVKERFVEAVKVRVAASEVVPLRDVLFDFAYPTPPSGWLDCASSS